MKGRTKRVVIVFAVVALVVVLASGAAIWLAARTTFVPVNPKCTYLRTHGDRAGDATPLALAELGIEPGDSIRLRVAGDFFSGKSHRAHLLGLFSESADLLPPTEPRRVAGAIEAGQDYRSIPTSADGLETDIPEDFLVTDIVLRVPDGAKYIFFSVVDSLFGDNTDDNQDFGVRIGGLPFGSPGPETDAD